MSGLFEGAGVLSGGSVNRLAIATHLEADMGNRTKGAKRGAETVRGYHHHPGPERRETAGVYQVRTSSIDLSQHFTQRPLASSELKFPQL